jgi:uncharacterized protein (DUF58 family)
MDTPRRRRIALGTAAVLGVLGAMIQGLPLVIWAVAVGTIAALGILWARLAWRAVEVEARFHPNRVFPSEGAEVVLRIHNAKRLPVPSARVGVWLPEGLRPATHQEPASIHGFRRDLTLPGRSAITLRLPVTALRRGEYALRLVEAELSDPFALYPVRREVRPAGDLLVMPEPRIGVPVAVRRRLPFGLPAPALRMFEQPERFAGVRPYQSGDPLNRIHWKLTGHSGGLQVKLFEPTRSADVLLAMDLCVGEPFWDAIYPEIAEDTIGWASFLARLALGAGWRIGIVANTHMSQGRGPVRVLPGSARGHEADLFAAMARMPNAPTSDLAPIIREMRQGLSTTTAAVVISPRPGPWLRRELDVLARRGVNVVQVSPLEARAAVEMA